MYNIPYTQPIDEIDFTFKNVFVPKIESDVPGTVIQMRFSEGGEHSFNVINDISQNIYVYGEFTGQWFNQRI